MHLASKPNKRTYPSKGPSARKDQSAINAGISRIGKRVSADSEILKKVKWLEVREVKGNRGVWQKEKIKLKGDIIEMLGIRRGKPISETSVGQPLDYIAFMHPFGDSKKIILRVSATKYSGYAGQIFVEVTDLALRERILKFFIQGTRVEKKTNLTHKLKIPDFKK